MKKQLTRLSTSECKVEFHVPRNAAWVIIPFSEPDGSHKIWRILCLRDSGDYKEGEFAEFEYYELWRAQRYLGDLLEQDKE